MLHLRSTSARPVVDPGSLHARDGAAPTWCSPPEVLPRVVGACAPMRRLARTVRRAATTGLPVLVRGESGTGKELVARAVHASSGRAHAAFVAVNGGGLTAALAGSALFGHVKGGFTGASQAREGAFRRADGGSLFIDEVGALPPEVQASLLRVLEEGVVAPIGGDESVPVDVRVISATCEGLEEAVERGRFRGDLYERLAACVLRVPPLRERQGDLPLLVPHLLEGLGGRGVRIDPGIYDVLAMHPFRGNVRELRNVLCQAMLEVERDGLGPVEIRRALASRRGSRLVRPSRPSLTATRVKQLLEETQGNVTAAARLAKVPRTTFRDAVRRFSAAG